MFLCAEKTAKEPKNTLDLWSRILLQISQKTFSANLKITKFVNNMKACTANTFAMVLIWDRSSVQVFLVQGQLIPGSGPSLDQWWVWVPGRAC